MTDLIQPYLNPEIESILRRGAAQFLSKKEVREVLPTDNQLILAYTIFQDCGVDPQTILELLTPRDDLNADPNFGKAFLTGQLPIREWNDTLGIVLAELNLGDKPYG